MEQDWCPYCGTSWNWQFGRCLNCEGGMEMDFLQKLVDLVGSEVVLFVGDKKQIGILERHGSSEFSVNGIHFVEKVVQECSVMDETICIFEKDILSRDSRDV